MLATATETSKKPPFAKLGQQLSSSDWGISVKRTLRAIAAAAAAIALVAGFATPAQADVRAQATIFPCDWPTARWNGYFYLDIDNDFIGDCIANAGYQGLWESGYVSYWSGNNRGSIEVITAGGVNYSQPFEKGVQRNLSPSDTVVGVTIF